ncbi:hypothetical protein GCM10027562_19500 [Arthrobacter pigmenti]
MHMPGSSSVIVRRLFALVLILALWALVGCGGGQGVDPSPHPEVTASGSAVRLVGAEEADLLLYVSNQSFNDEESA